MKQERKQVKPPHYGGLKRKEKKHERSQAREQ